MISPAMVRRMSISAIVTHPGGAHKDDFLACSLLVYRHGCAVFRREPSEADISNPAIAVVDVGGEHDPEKANFDHHQFPRDYPPTCALTLVLQDIGLYEDAKLFCDWVEPAEWFDTRGPVDTGKWLGVDRETMAKLNSPIDITVLRRFAQKKEFHPGNPIWELMRMIGEDLVVFVTTMRKKMDYLSEHLQFWPIEGAEGKEAAFLPRVEGSSDDPSAGMARYILNEGKDKTVIALVYPDRRGPGYGLSRMSDSNHMEYTRISEESDVHFAHNRGFIAKTTATDEARLQQLLAQSYIATF